MSVDMLAINAAFEGNLGVKDGAVKDTTLKWALGRVPEVGLPLGGSHEYDRDWRHPDVGWGLVLRDRDDLDSAAKARGDDAPEPLRRLLQVRRAIDPKVPVLRYLPNRPFTKLRRYDQVPAGQDLQVGMSYAGTEPGRIPRYLLIYGSPDPSTGIPWSAQYALHGRHFVGRLDLEGEALANYVDHLIGGWPGSEATASTTLAWSVVEPGDPKKEITALMRTLIADKVRAELAKDSQLGQAFTFLDGMADHKRASAASLAEQLSQKKPGLIVTTSHGRTGPLDDAIRMRADMGLLVDQDGANVTTATLLSHWQPDGAIWYAHACCSAGSASTSVFKGVVDAATYVGRVLSAVTAAGDTIAPLPRALLSAKKPARAFVGHVEPTFDWTLRDPVTGQNYMGRTVDALARQAREGPVSWAFREVHGCGTQLHHLHQQALQAYDGKLAALDRSVLAVRLAAFDIPAMVVLGDPTAILMGGPHV